VLLTRSGLLFRDGGRFVTSRAANVGDGGGWAVPGFLLQRDHNFRSLATAVVGSTPFESIIVAAVLRVSRSRVFAALI